MSSLTQTAIIARKIIRLSIFGIIFLISARIIFGVGYKIYRRYNPVPPPPPTLDFGRLPKISFPEKKDLPKFDYVLETPEGDLPTLPTQARVFLIPRQSAKLFSLEEARQRAKSMGFTTEERELSQTLYQFKNPNSNSTLDLNIANGFFSINYDLASNPEILSLQAPNSETAITLVRSFLASGNSLPKDLGGNPKTQFLKASEGKFVPAISQSEANFIKVSFFREDIEKLPSLTADPEQGNVWFILSGSGERGKQIIAGEYHYLAIDKEQSGTYPLKSPSEAWEELKNGLGYVASIGANQEGQLKIRKVYLAYYDPGTPTDFFQPIIVFEGDRGFVAYIPAVATEFYGAE